ncbi:ATP-binding domain-containing protein [Occultella gossypii]|uniref:ATP-binding domain-containing protein n=1 Tax=Occultella gossypii TaxID=2800820 RepID=A0ABS7SGG9_9MICO|nr:ATP-binding domain-containing protein [Occultella gossypii]
MDEAQDFGDLWWTSLLRCLRDPAHGGLFLFGDAGQRVFAPGGTGPIDLPPFELDENLRSTKPIAQLSGSVSDRRITPRGGAGAPVRLIDVPAEDAVEAADDAVEALLDEGWDPGDVALLTTRTRHLEQVNRIDAVGHDTYWDDFFDGTDVFYGHVLNFKGLERPVVVLAANGFRDAERARSMLYTGLSRARSLLVVAGPRAEIERIGGDAARHRLVASEAWALQG